MEGNGGLRRYRRCAEGGGLGLHGVGVRNGDVVRLGLHDQPGAQRLHRCRRPTDRHRRIGRRHMLDRPWSGDDVDAGRRTAGGSGASFTLTFEVFAGLWSIATDASSTLNSFIAANPGARVMLPSGVIGLDASSVALSQIAVVGTGSISSMAKEVDAFRQGTTFAISSPPNDGTATASGSWLNSNSTITLAGPCPAVPAGEIVYDATLGDDIPAVLKCTGGGTALVPKGNASRASIGSSDALQSARRFHGRRRRHD